MSTWSTDATLQIILRTSNWWVLPSAHHLPNIFSLLAHTLCINLLINQPAVVSGDNLCWNTRRSELDQLLATTDTDSLPLLSQCYYLVMKSPIFEVSRFQKSGRNLGRVCGVVVGKVTAVPGAGPCCCAAVWRLLPAVVFRHRAPSHLQCSDTGPPHTVTSSPQQRH